MHQRGSYTVFADYFQFYLWDRDAAPEAPTEYTDDDVIRRVKTGQNVAVIQPVRNMDVPVEIEIHDADPGFEAAAWDHVAECSLDIPSGNLQLHECTGGPIANFSIPPGVYRVRALFGKLGEVSDDQSDGSDHYTIALWPAPFAETSVLKQWSG